MRNPYDEFDQNEEEILKLKEIGRQRKSLNRQSRANSHQSRFSVQNPNRSPLPLNDNDSIVQGTNSDAILSRKSAIDIGYFEDKFTRFMTSENVKRAPIINRGTFVRTKAIDKLLELGCKVLHHWQNESSNVQIVSLGAGSDTRFFRLQDQGILNHKYHAYFEVDFEAVTKKKVRVMRDNPAVFQSDVLLKECSWSESECFSKSCNYALLAADIRDWDNVIRKLSHAGFKHDIPTIWIAECFLIYLDQSVGDKIIEFASNCTEKKPNTLFITYDPFKPDDAFGQVMRKNLDQRGIKMPSLSNYPDENSQIERYKSRGLSCCELVSVRDFYRNNVSGQEKQR